MPDYGNWGKGSAGPSYSDISAARRGAVKDAEEEIIRHVELATGKKHVLVNGEDKYVPLEDAKRLGLLEDESHE